MFLMTTCDDRGQEMLKIITVNEIIESGTLFFTFYKIN